jgi:predicted Zn-dependent protease
MEADQLGVQYMWNTGYDPNAFISFFEKLQAKEKEKPGRLAGWFRTHPFTDTRIAASIDEQRYLPEKDSYIVDTSEFIRIKNRLLAIDNAEKTEAGGGPALEQKKPTLKRRTNPDGTETNPGSDDPGQEQKKSRPTLKRPTDQPQEDPK